MRKEFRIFAADDIMTDSVVFMFRHASGKPIKPLEFSVDNDIQDGYMVEPTFRLRRDDAQELMQELWRLGYRPNNGESTVAHIDALKYHLEDMRKLAFRKVKGRGN